MVNKLLKNQFIKYPELQPQDILKVLYQSEFGCAHFNLGDTEGMRYLTDELAMLNEIPQNQPLCEEIGGQFCRVHLGAIAKAGLSPRTLFQLFVLSSRYNPGTRERFSNKLDGFLNLCADGELPFNSSKIQKLITDYKANGCPAIHHSPQFRETYHPAYRVIRLEYGRLLPLFSRIDQLLAEKPHVITAIDGNSASGKTTLAALLAEVYDCNVFHMDDFFLRPNQRTEARLTEPGGNVDYERFRSEVVDNLINGNTITYQPYDCQTQTLRESITTAPRSLTVIEGAYSLHPTLSEAFDIKVLVTTSPEVQAERILARNGAEMQKRFLKEWIPMENRYLKHFNIPKQCDLIFLDDGEQVNLL